MCIWHDDCTAWKQFLHHYPIVVGIHMSLLDFPLKQASNVKLLLLWNWTNLWRSNCWSFEMLWYSHDVTVMENLSHRQSTFVGEYCFKGLYKNSLQMTNQWCSDFYQHHNSWPKPTTCNHCITIDVWAGTGSKQTFYYRNIYFQLMWLPINQDQI